MEKAERIEALKNTKQTKKIGNKAALIKELQESENPANQYYLQKGVVEGGSLLGSVLGLAVLAPEISHHCIHPVMKFLGMEKDK